MNVGDMKMSIDRESHISMYMQIANLLESQMLSGELKPGQKLPTEAELTEMYEVSRMTVRLALQTLIDKRLVVRKQGKGTFVTESLVHHELGGMTSFYDSFRAQDIEATLAEMRLVDTPADVYEKLQDQFAKTLYLKRTYMRKNVVLGYSDIYFPPQLAQKVTWDLAEKLAGYSLLMDPGGYELKQATVTIRAGSCTQEQADVLKIGRGDPVLYLFRTSFTTNDKPIEHLKLTLRADLCEFNMVAPSHFSVLNSIRKRTGSP